VEEREGRAFQRDDLDAGGAQHGDGLPERFEKAVGTGPSLEILCE
jgi:hypothetical protein